MSSASAILPLPEPPANAPTPLVSICCITYNHARFIARALEGFLMQRTDFPVEILVHDDASDDATAEIVRDYLKRFPGKIRAVLREENQHRQGRGIMPLFATWARGEFIALCEGDDYWTAPEKLQTQVDFLTSHHDSVACFHDAVLVDDEGQTTAPSYFGSSKDSFTRADVIGSLMSREPTCSLMFRRSAFVEPLPAWFARNPSDLYLDILLSGHGLLRFIDKNWAAYRIHQGGTWSGKREATQIAELIFRYKNLLFEPEFAPQREIIQRKIAEFQSLLFTRYDAGQELDRLNETVSTQTRHISILSSERDRLTTEVAQARDAASRAATEAQQHIDALRSQLDRTVAENEKTIAALRPQVAETVARYEAVLAPLKQQLEQLSVSSQEQTKLIAVLETERDRLMAETAQSRAETARVLVESQKHIDSLKAQLDRTATENEKTIAALRPQVADAVARYEAVLAPLKSQLDQLAATSAEQAKHIAVVERERDRLSLETDRAREESARTRSDGQKLIDALSLQLEQLAATSREQAAHIAVLEKERDRLGAREAQLSVEAAHYLKVMEEQLAYIKILEAARDRAASPHA